MKVKSILLHTINIETIDIRPISLDIEPLYNYGNIHATARAVLNNSTIDAFEVPLTKEELNEIYNLFRKISKRLTDDA